MKNIDKCLMKRIYWINRYFKRIEKLFDAVHKKWLKLSIRSYDSSEHKSVTKLKNKILLRMRVLVRYSSIITSKIYIKINEK